MYRIILVPLWLMVIGATWAEDKPIPLGDRTELFVDEHLIAEKSDQITLRLHKPEAKEVVLTTDEPWEGNTCAYYTIFQDGDLYRMYYRGSHWDSKTKRATHPEVTCYAESKDGIHWKKPALGLYDFEGSKQNNIVWDGIGTHDFTPFKDANPDCPEGAKYKALARGRPKGKKGLYAFQSPDGIHWKLMSKEPVITLGAFDSQNLAFWDTEAKLYREYHRHFREGRRDIMTGTSKDFLHWTKPVFLKFPGAPKEHLYTNAVRPYFRAPHLLIGFPTRYLPKQGQRVEPVFMSSRDGVTFKRWDEAVIPETAPKDRGGNRSNYMTWGLLQLPGKPDELSVYATEAYYTGPAGRVRRFTYRLDGFVSLHSEGKGVMVTKPLTFSGKELVLNHRGRVKVEVLDGTKKVLESKPLEGDSVRQVVSWNGKLADWIGKSVRLRFVMEDADLFSITFAK